MKLSDYVANFIAKQGVKHVFLISGGAVLHLVDSVAKHPSLKYICTQHEEAAAMAAEAYARVSGNLGVAMTTSGPGATNLVTGVCGAYFDSIPTLYITGQVARFRIKRDEKLRQKGFQETDIVSIFKPITKYAALIEDPDDIRYELEKAVYIAQIGRPGPVLLDIPDDVQRVDIDPTALRAYPLPTGLVHESHYLKNRLELLNAALKKCTRPVVIFGAGIRIAKAEQQAIDLVKKLNIPVLLTWGGCDLLSYNDPMNIGVFGVCGPRGANFVVQRADLIIALGTRVSQMITGGKQALFSPQAYKVVVDIDTAELAKFSEMEIKVDLEINCDMKEFFQKAADLCVDNETKKYEPWWKYAQFAKHHFPICLSKNTSRKSCVDAYVFIETLSNYASEKDIIVTDAGGNLSWTMQAYRVKQGQLLFSSWNHSPMGYSLPASVGAALFGRRVLCVIGDGGLMMCMAELGTIIRHKLPVKVFIFNNHGHGIQKQTLDTWLNSRYEAVDEATGLMFPDFLAVGKAFGLEVVNIRNHDELSAGIAKTLECTGPVLCNVEIFGQQRIEPMLKFGGSLEDLDPKLSIDDLKKLNEMFECV